MLKAPGAVAQAAKPRKAIQGEKSAATGAAAGAVNASKARLTQGLQKAVSPRRHTHQRQRSYAPYQKGADRTSWRNRDDDAPSSRLRRRMTAWLAPIVLASSGRVRGCSSGQRAARLARQSKRRRRDGGGFQSCRQDNSWHATRLPEAIPSTPALPGSAPFGRLNQTLEATRCTC